MGSMLVVPAWPALRGQVYQCIGGLWGQYVNVRMHTDLQIVRFLNHQDFRLKILPQKVCNFWQDKIRKVATKMKKKNTKNTNLKSIQYPWNTLIIQQKCFKLNIALPFQTHLPQKTAKYGPQIKFYNKTLYV